MKLINANCGEVNYPVGMHISHNLPVIQELAKAFNKEQCKGKINVFCMGSSGAIMAAIFASIVENVTILHVKKDGEKSHSECDNFKRFVDNGEINIIIDDFIISGDTMNTMYGKINPKIEIDYLILGFCFNVERKLNCINFTPKNVIYTHD